MSDRAVLAALVAVHLLTSCGDSSGDGVGLPLQPTAELEPAEPCPGASTAEDEAGDSTQPSWDLRRLELSATDAGLCVRWTTDGPAFVGTTFFLGAHGPWQQTPSGGSVSHGYGFNVELVEEGAEVTFGLADVVNDTPNVLSGRVGQSGNTVSTFVPRSELDRSPANMPDRPPFPYDAFIVEARVLDATEGIADSWPQEPSRQAGYVDGEFCGPPCSESSLFGVPQPELVP